MSNRFEIFFVMIIQGFWRTRDAIKLNDITGNDG